MTMWDYKKQKKIKKESSADTRFVPNVSPKWSQVTLPNPQLQSCLDLYKLRIQSTHFAWQVRLIPKDCWCTVGKAWCSTHFMISLLMHLEAISCFALKRSSPLTRVWEQTAPKRINQHYPAYLVVGREQFVSLGIYLFLQVGRPEAQLIKLGKAGSLVFDS